MIQRLCILGVGLIGGSIARAAKLNGLCQSVAGFDTDQANLQKALELGVIDQAYQSMEEAVQASDWVVLAMPVGSFESVLKRLQPVWSPHTLYTDAGSTKCSLIRAAQKVFGAVPANLVPAHPIAGAERSGVEASLQNLYSGKRLIITPVAETDSAMLKRVEEFWVGLGANVSCMSPEHHDEVLAATSHLPHVLAYSLVHMLGRKDEQKEIFQYAAGGFRDFTRIASSDPKMWLDICMANAEHIVPLIDELTLELKKVNSLLSQGSSDELFEFFTDARSARQRFLDQLEK